MTNTTDVSDMKMTRLRQGVNLMLDVGKLDLANRSGTGWVVELPL